MKKQALKIESEASREITYMARALVQATLPHRCPDKNLSQWSRRNGNFVLSIRPGWNTQKNESLGYPYGVIPRLLLFWLTTEAIKTGDRKIFLGNSLSSFMKELGLNPSNGTGQRSDTYRLRDQMERLFRATISFDVKEEINPQKNVSSWLDMQIAPFGEFWWNPKVPDDKVLFDSWIELSEAFFQAVTQRPVPLDMSVLQVLKNSPLALDLYAWSSYKTFSLTKNQKDFHISWKELSFQFGAEYTRRVDLKRKIIQALVKIISIYDGLKIRESESGLILSPGRPSITPKLSTKKLFPPYIKGL